MKVNQIVTEHKKGVKAMKYAKKAKSTVPLYGPGKQEAKLTPVKPITPVKEDDNTKARAKVAFDQLDNPNTELKTSSDAEIRARLAAQQGKGTKLKDMNPLDRDQWLKSTGQYWDTATQTVKPLPVKEDAPIGVVSAVSPDGKEVTIKKTDGSELKTTGSAVMPGADGKTAQLAPQAGDSLKPGTPVTSGEAPVSEEGDDLASGKLTIPLDKFMQIADENNKENGFNIDLEQLKPMLVMTSSGEVDAGLTLQKIAGFFQGPEFTKFIEDMRKMIAFAEQNRPGPTKTAAAGNAPYNPMNRPEAKLGTGTFDSGPDVTLSTRVQETADNKLLKNMLNIAGVGNQPVKPKVKESADITAMLRIAGLR